MIENHFHIFFGNIFRGFKSYSTNLKSVMQIVILYPSNKMSKSNFVKFEISLKLAIEPIMLNNDIDGIVNKLFERIFFQITFVIGY